MKKSIKFLFLTSTITFPVVAQVPAETDIYTVSHSDSLLTPMFVDILCKAARNHTEPIPGRPSLLEQLILKASGAEFHHPTTPEKTKRWHSKYGHQAYCGATKEYPAGDFLRQIVYSNYRDFANIIGPNNRLSLALELTDPNDGMDLFEFVNKYRMDVEARHDNRRFEFQQDEDWRNIMFFYFLFSEYKINYGAQLKE